MKAFLIKHSEALLISTLAVFAPVKDVIVVVALSVVVDFVVGIIAAKKRGEEIKSSKMTKSISKLLIIETAIIMGFLIQHYLMADAFSLVNLVAGVFGLKEAYSIMESLNSISGGELFKDILTKLSSINAKGEEIVKEEKKEEVKIEVKEEN